MDMRFACFIDQQSLCCAFGGSDEDLHPSASHLTPCTRLNYTMRSQDTLAKLSYSLNDLGASLTSVDVIVELFPDKS